MTSVKSQEREEVVASKKKLGDPTSEAAERLAEEIDKQVLEHIKDMAKLLDKASVPKEDRTVLLPAWLAKGLTGDNLYDEYINDYFTSRTIDWVWNYSNSND